MVSIYFFFFSSRRRHTRWPRDWSSDVCSSDLLAAGGGTGLAADPVVQAARADRAAAAPGPALRLALHFTCRAWADPATVAFGEFDLRHSRRLDPAALAEAWSRTHP